MAKGWTDKRPMSPHLTVWKWHPAMVSSILHRTCAIIAYAGLIKLAIVVLLLAGHGKLPLERLIFSLPGAIGLFVLSFALIFMAAAQLRHLIWDRGRMLEPDFNNTLSVFMILGSVVLSAILTFIATGGV